jgi:hypothetical protein
VAGDLVGRSARVDASESAWLALRQGEKPALHPLMKLSGFSIQPILPFQNLLPARQSVGHR